MMLPPRQARVFARLARWQLIYRLQICLSNVGFVVCPNELYKYVLITLEMIVIRVSVRLMQKSTSKGLK